MIFIMALVSWRCKCEQRKIRIFFHCRILDVDLIFLHITVLISLKWNSMRSLRRSGGRWCSGSELSEFIFNLRVKGIYIIAYRNGFIPKIVFFTYQNGFLRRSFKQRCVETLQGMLKFLLLSWLICSLIALHLTNQNSDLMLLHINVDIRIVSAQVDHHSFLVVYYT